MREKPRGAGGTVVHRLCEPGRGDSSGDANEVRGGRRERRERREVALQAAREVSTALHAQTTPGPPSGQGRLAACCAYLVWGCRGRLCDRAPVRPCARVPCSYSLAFVCAALQSVILNGVRGVAVSVLIFF